MSCGSNSPPWPSVGERSLQLLHSTRKFGATRAVGNRVDGRHSYDIGCDAKIRIEPPSTLTKEEGQDVWAHSMNSFPGANGLWSSRDDITVTRGLEIAQRIIYRSRTGAVRQALAEYVLYRNAPAQPAYCLVPTQLNGFVSFGVPSK